MEHPGRSTRDAEQKAASKSVWGASPAGSTHALGLEPGTREFFETVLAKRSTQELPWLPEVFPFEASRGKRVLEIGCGAGYDAYEFCRNGALYTGIDLTPENIERTRKHLSFYGWSPEVIQADAEELPFEADSFDIVFSNGVLHHTPDLPKALEEIRRVLTPGGQLWMTVYHRDSIFYWLSVGLFDHLLTGGFRVRTFRERVAMIEYTTSGELPLVNVYSRGQVRRTLRRLGFHVDVLVVRKLVAEDMPGMGRFTPSWDRVPQRWLDRLGRWFGWYVVSISTKEVDR